MSGPKCYSYVVREDPAVVAARAEEAALRQARGRVEVAVLRLRTLHDEAAALRHRYGGAVAEIALPEAGERSTSGETARLAELLEQSAAAADAKLRSEQSAARTASFVAQLAGSGVTPADAAGLDRFLEAAAARAAAHAKRDAEPDAQAEALAVECVRVFERLRDDIPEAARDTAERTFRAALDAAGTERAPLLVDRLRGAVAAANAEAVQRFERAQRVDVLLAGLGGLDEAAAERLRLMLLAERAAGKPVDALEAEVAAVRAEAERRLEEEQRLADRARVGRALSDAFAELGYDVQGGFDIALTDSGSALARRDGWDEHAVRVHLDRRTNRLRLHVVRDDRPRLDASRDVVREEELCADRPALERALAAREIELAPEELIEPGVVPLAVVPLTAASFPARGRRLPGYVAEKRR